MQSNFSNVGFNRNLLKKTQFNKKCISFSTFKTNRSVPNIYQTLPFSACEQFTLPAYLVRSNKALWSQFFSFFWSRFLFFSYQHVTYDFRYVDKRFSIVHEIITFLHAVINSVLVINVQMNYRLLLLRFRVNMKNI